MAKRVLSQLAHVELLTPDPEASARFWADVLGLEESGRDGGSIYLRCWGERFYHSVQLTEGPQAALGHVGWRAEGPDEIEEAVARLEAVGAGEGWVDGSTGHGPAYRYRGPGGQVQEVFWEVERWQAPPEFASTLPNRVQRVGVKGCALRQIDHVTVTSTPDALAAAHWYRDVLGYRFTEYTVASDEDVCFFAMLTTNEHSHDLGLLRDTSGVPGRVHHVAFWLDDVAGVYRAAEVLLEASAPLEYGPGRHGMGEDVYCYTREPGGMRVELTSGGRRNYEPDWQTIKWHPSQGSMDFYRNSPPPSSIVEVFPSTADGQGFADANPWEVNAIR
jgi:catechol 2,3-dioxygenase